MLCFMYDDLDGAKDNGVLYFGSNSRIYVSSAGAPEGGSPWTKTPDMDAPNMDAPEMDSLDMDTSEKHTPEERIGDMVSYALIHQMGDKYEIAGLQDFVSLRFGKCVLEPDHDDFLAAIPIIYSIPPSSNRDLRDSAVNSWMIQQWQRHSIVDDAEELFRKVPEFGCDLALHWNRAFTLGEEGVIDRECGHIDSVCNVGEPDVRCLGCERSDCQANLSIDGVLSIGPLYIRPE